jgi:hypothetical protein
MPGYITSMLHKYQHPPSKRPQYALHIWTEPVYGQRIQYAPLPEDSVAASAADITRAQGIVGTLLYYARSVDPTLNMPISTIASRLSTATTTTMAAVSHLLDYCSTKHNATIRYYASDMQLKIHSDASYLSEPNAKSRIGGYFFLGNSKHSQVTSLSNGPLLCQSTVLKHLVSSIAESEYGALFVNAKTGTVTRETLKEMGHPQDATDLKTYNTTADGIANKRFSKKYPRIWTCARTGSKTTSSKDNSTSAGPPVTQTWVTTLQSTTPRPITSDSAHFISTATLSQ